VPLIEGKPDAITSGGKKIPVSLEKKGTEGKIKVQMGKGDLEKDKNKEMLDREVRLA